MLLSCSYELTVLFTSPETLASWFPGRTDGWATHFINFEHIISN